MVCRCLHAREKVAVHHQSRNESKFCVLLQRDPVTDDLRNDCSVRRWFVVPARWGEIAHIWSHAALSLWEHHHYCCPRNGLQRVLISTLWIMGNVGSVSVQSEDRRPWSLSGSTERGIGSFSTGAHHQHCHSFCNRVWDCIAAEGERFECKLQSIVMNLLLSIIIQVHY